VTEYEISCLDKVRFHCRRHAKRTSSRIRRTGGPNLRPYPCRYCGYWHLGHRPGHATYLRTCRNGPVPVQELTP
jgi:hypothetical protein